MKKLNPIKDSFSFEKIVSLLLESYNPPTPFESVQNADDVYNNRIIYNCDDIKYLENRTVNPILTYGLGNEKKGELHLDSGLTVDIEKKVFYKNELGADDNMFQRHLETFYKYLKVQEWPGVPRIYGACLLSKNKQDLSRRKNGLDNIHQLT